MHVMYIHVYTHTHCTMCTMYIIRHDVHVHVHMHTEDLVLRVTLFLLVFPCSKSLASLCSSSCKSLFLTVTEARSDPPNEASTSCLALSAWRGEGGREREREGGGEGEREWGGGRESVFEIVREMEKE